jgi:hypothetical protein
LLLLPLRQESFFGKTGIGGGGEHRWRKVGRLSPFVVVDSRKIRQFHSPQ